MTLNPMLLERLACPQDHGPLLYFDDENRLYNPRLRRSYGITDDIPIMLIDEATDVSADEHERLLAKAAGEGIKPTFEPPSDQKPADQKPAGPPSIDGPA